MWVEVEGPWELNQRKEAEASVWEGVEMLLGFDRRQRASKSDDDEQMRRRRASATIASKCDDGE